jgi:hypothetical protein
MLTAQFPKQVFKARRAMRHFARKTWHGIRTGLVSGLLMIAMGGMGGPLVSATEARGSESPESVPVSERQEEFTTFGRFDHERLLKLEQRRRAIYGEVTDSSHLGHTQNIVLLAPTGHRLSNGLLAPLTC